MRRLVPLAHSFIHSFVCCAIRLTILKLKEVLDAKEETILFLDDKMKYYEELLGNSDQKSA